MLMAEITRCADSKKAEDIKVLDIRELTTMADYFVICHGNSNAQMRAISEEIEDKLKEKGVLPEAREGKDNATWILMDYADVIVHIFGKESREFYGIEHLWADAKNIDVEQLLKEGCDDGKL
jgi:ribosome-associated protein